MFRRCFEVFSDRVNVQPFASYMQYLESLSQTDISIVPLTIDRFNECKSAIRYIEAALCGVPTIASAVGQFSEIIASGNDGYLADSHEAWVSSLEELVQNTTLRRSMGMAARKKVMESHTVSAQGAIEQNVISQFLLSHE